MYCSDDYRDDCSHKESLIRKGFPIIKAYGLEDLFYKYGVDVEIWAHVSLWMRWLKLHKSSKRKTMGEQSAVPINQRLVGLDEWKPRVHQFWWNFFKIWIFLNFRKKSLKILWIPAHLRGTCQAAGMIFDKREQQLFDLYLTIEFFWKNLKVFGHGSTTW